MFFFLGVPEKLMFSHFVKRKSKTKERHTSPRVPLLKKEVQKEEDR